MNDILIIIFIFVVSFVSVIAFVYFWTDNIKNYPPLGLVVAEDENIIQKHLLFNLTVRFRFYKTKLNKQEKEYVYTYFYKYYNFKDENEIYNRIKSAIRYKHYKNKLSNCNLPHKDRLQAFFFVIKLCAIDGFIDFQEQKFLEECRIGLNISKQMYKTVSRKYFEKYFEKKETYNRKEGYKRVVRLPNYNRAYGILGITKEATAAEIKKTYRTLAKIHHPDKYFRQGDKAMKQAEEQFQEITQAYEIIKRKRGIN